MRLLYLWWVDLMDWILQKSTHLEIRNLTDKLNLRSYAYNSIKMAIDTCADPEVVECNMMTMPGLINTALTEHIIKTCEDRADSLAIIDIENGYTPSSENADAAKKIVQEYVDSAVSNLSQRGINSSYGCCYYPWVQARDSETGNTFWCPPSVAAIGTFSSATTKIRTLVCSGRIQSRWIN